MKNLDKENISYVKDKLKNEDSWWEPKPTEDIIERINRRSYRKLPPLVWPHDMQITNMKVLQESFYPHFNGDLAIYAPEVPFIVFFNLINKKVNFFKSGAYYVALGHKIMLCNPCFTKKQLHDCLMFHFDKFVKIPKSKKLIQSLTKKYSTNIEYHFANETHDFLKQAAEIVFSQPYKGKIKIKPKVIFNPDYDLTKEQRNETSGKLKGEAKSSKTLDKITEIFKTNPDFTQKEIAAVSGIPLRTIQRYLKQVKSPVYVCE